MAHWQSLDSELAAEQAPERSPHMIASRGDRLRLTSEPLSVCVCAGIRSDYFTEISSPIRHAKRLPVAVSAGIRNAA